MSTVDDRPTGDAERQLAVYFGWLDTELGPVGMPEHAPEVSPDDAPTRDRPSRRWWLAAAAAALVLAAGLALVVGRNGGGEQVPASPTGDLRDVSGWFELDLPDVEVIESYTTDPSTVHAVERDPYYVWADLDGDPIRAMSAAFLSGDVPLDLDDDVDPPARIESAPAGEAWVVDDPAAGARILRVQWTRPDGVVVLTSGTNVDAATLAEWTFAVGGDESIPPSPPDPDLELLLDASQTEPGATYQENWVVDGVDVSAWVSRSAPAVWFGLGYPTVERVTVAGRDGYRFGGGAEQPALFTFPLRNGYWGTLTTPADRADELVEHVVIVDDSFPTPDEVMGDDDEEPDEAAVGRDDLAAVWARAVVEELSTFDADLAVELTSATESYPIAAVSIVPIESGGRLLVELHVWPTGRYDDPSSWFAATGATRFGTSYPEGAVFTDTDGPRPRVGAVTELGVVELVVELPAGDDEIPAFARFDDPDALDAAVGLARRLTARVPDVVASAGVDRDAGTVCVDAACRDRPVLARIEIPSIGVDASVVASSRAELLDEGPGLVPGNVPIGSPGVVRIWGHRTTADAALRDLDQLRPGGVIVLTTPAGEQFTYVARSVEVVPADEPMGASLGSTLVLSTPEPELTSRQELRVTADICSRCLPDVPIGDPAPIPAP